MKKVVKVTRRKAVGLAVAASSVVVARASTTAKVKPSREVVQGIGGFFFKAKDPKKLAAWYDDNLGVTRTPESYDGTPWRAGPGVTVFAPFEAKTTYFGDAKYQWMINFRVRNLDRMAKQLRASGITVEVDPQAYPNGRFAKLNDPEGNPIQLWEPGAEDMK